MTLQTFSERISFLERSSSMKQIKTLTPTEGASEVSDNPYLVEVNQSNTVLFSPESDEMLAADLLKTCGWLDEVIAEFRELEPKVDKNARWFALHDMSHPKYEQYAEVFNDQRDCLEGLLDRMRVLSELGTGEAGRMSKGANQKVVKRFMDLAEWVRIKRSAVAEAQGKEF